MAAKRKSKTLPGGKKLPRQIEHAKIGGGKRLGEICSVCGMQYADFKTGETYRTIYEQWWWRR